MIFHPFTALLYGIVVPKIQIKVDKMPVKFHWAWRKELPIQILSLMALFFNQKISSYEMKSVSWIFNFARYTQLFGKFLFGNFRGCRIDFPLEISLTKVRLHGSLFGSLFQALGQSGRSKKRADDEQVSDELADPARRPRPFSTRPEGLKLVSFLEIKLSQMSLSFVPVSKVSKIFVWMESAYYV